MLWQLNVEKETLERTNQLVRELYQLTGYPVDYLKGYLIGECDDPSILPEGITERPVIQWSVSSEE